ncbi:MAG TPA: methyl-accepting chemotaxis protein [Spirochaetota bacterium]|nr:methyl-accepting chemotaxis protein [Spirochaetota bacterium]
METQKKIGKLYLKFLLFTQGVPYFVLIPVSAFIFIQITGLKNYAPFLGVVAGISFTALTIAVFSNRKILRPLVTYYTKLKQGEEISDEEYLKARKCAFSLPKRHAISGMVRWLILAPVVIIYLQKSANATLLQQVNCYSVMTFNTIATTIVYYIVTEKLIEPFINEGIFSKLDPELNINKTRISHVLSFLSIGAISLLILVISLAVFNIQYKSIENSYTEQMKTISVLVDKQLESFIDKIGDDADFITEKESSAKSISSKNYGDIIATMKDYKKKYGIYDEILILSPDDYLEVFASTNLSLTGKNLYGDNQDLGLKKAFSKNFSSDSSGNKRHLSGVFKCSLTGQNVLLFTCPFVQNGKFIANIGFLIKAQSFYDKIYSAAIVGRNGYSVLFDSSLTTVSHPDQSMILKDMKDTDFAKKIIEGELLKPIKYFYNDRTKLMIAAKNSKYNMFTVTILDIDDIEESVIEYAVYILIFAAIGLLSAAFFASWLINRKMRPLSDYDLVIDGISKGDLSRKIIAHTDDEIGELSYKMIIFSENLKRIIRNIQSISGELAASSHEMSITAGAFSDISQNQAATAEEVTATTEQMSAGVDSVATSAEEQFKTIEELTQRMTVLSDAINQMSEKLKVAITTTDRISSNAKEGEITIGNLNKSMSQITASSKEMTGIVNIISDISEQINLLSLNAAIEAARAGDAGKGFAVVADEVSKLADQTATSIKQIDNFIVSTNSEITKGMQAAENTVSTISTIISNIQTISSTITALEETMKKQLETNKIVNDEARTMKNRTDEMKISTSEQKNAVGEIVKSITNINELTQQNAGGAEEIAGSAENVATLAEKLKETIQFFKF